MGIEDHGPESADKLAQKQPGGGLEFVEIRHLVYGNGCILAALHQRCIHPGNQGHPAATRPHFA